MLFDYNLSYKNNMKKFVLERLKFDCEKFKWEIKQLKKLIDVTNSETRHSGIISKFRF